MEPIATWNPARGAWETAETNLFCGHAALYSPTWPTSGSMRNGRLYPPRQSAHPTDASGYSSSPGLLPTPRVQSGGGMGQPDPHHAERGFRLNLATSVSLLRTPTSQLAVNGGSQHPEKRKAGGHGPTLADEVEHLLPTPSVAIATGGQSSRSGDRIDELLLTGIARAATDGLLLPTPSAQNSHGNANRGGDRAGELLLPGVAQTLLPTPAAHDSANTPENHLRKKPGRSQVTSLQIVVDYGLLSSGGRMPSPSADGSTPPAAQRHVQLSLDGLESG